MRASRIPNMLTRKPTYGRLALLLLAVWPLGCLGSKQDRAIAKVGRHLERIHDADYRFSLHRMTAPDAAVRMYKEVEAIRKQFPAITDTAAIKEPLRAFLEKWNAPELIEASIKDDRQEFMAQVTGFYLSGTVKRREGGRTLFPFMKP
jgi:hypothetical protein